MCHERKFIFFHIPRCGGTSFEAYFNMHDRASLYGLHSSGKRVLTLHHLTATDLVEEGLLDDLFLKTYFKFTVIRPPFERMASDFCWQKLHDRHGEFTELSFPQYLDKAERIMRDARYFEKVHYDHFRPMTDFCIRNGELLVDDILRLDHIEVDLCRIRDRLGDVALPRLNHARDYSILRTRENIERVEDIYACDKLLYDNVELLLGRE
ncbi:MAG: sulfotransferase family 2 domain-containing protein [Congregibacter sp.]